MAHDKQALIIAMMKKKPEGKGASKDVSEPKEESSMEHWTACGADLLAALEAKDAKRVGMVLQAASDLGGEEEEKETPEEEKSEDY